MEWQVLTTGLSPAGMMNDMNDDQVVRLCHHVKLSLASASRVTFFYVSFDIIIFKLASLFHGSLMQSHFLRRFWGPLSFMGISETFQHCWMCSSAHLETTRGLGSFHKTPDGFCRCFRDLHGYKGNIPGVLWWVPGITETLDGGSRGLCASFKGFQSVPVL